MGGEFAATPGRMSSFDRRSGAGAATKRRDAVFPARIKLWAELMPGETMQKPDFQGLSQIIGDVLWLLP
jgi:hypothetical protein